MLYLAKSSAFLAGRMITSGSPLWCAQSNATDEGMIEANYDLIYSLFTTFWLVKLQNTTNTKSIKIRREKKQRWAIQNYQIKFTRRQVSILNI